MKTLILAYLFAHVVLSLSGCSSSGTGPHRSRSDGYSPAAIKCVTPTDPECVGSATVGVEVQLGNPAASTSGDMSLPHLQSRALRGRCEVYPADGGSPTPCTSIKLVARSTREAEIRNVQITGFDFRVENLTQESYQLQSLSPDFEVIPEAQPYRPGETIKLRLRRLK